MMVNNKEYIKNKNKKPVAIIPIADEDDNLI